MFFKRIKNKIALALISVMILCFPVLKIRVRNHLLMMIFLEAFTSSSEAAKQSAPVDDWLGGFGTKLKPPSQNGSVGYDNLLPEFGI